jgi:hypothetical protein
LTYLSRVADWITSLKVLGAPWRTAGGEGRPHPWKVIFEQLDEALRYSARTARCPEAETGAEGNPPHEIQPDGIFADFKLDELPELRFLGWATYRETETAIVVTAERPGSDPLLLGSWPRSVWLEYARRFYEAEGE